MCELYIGPYPAHNAHLMKVTKALSEAGAEVTLIHSCPPDDRLDDEGFKAVWVAPFVASHHPVWAIRVATNLFREHIGFPLRYRLAALRSRADVYHAHFLDSMAAAAFAARLRRARLVFDVLDLFVDEGVHIWPPRTLRHFKRLEKKLTPRADVVLSVSEPMADLLESRYRIRRSEVLMNGAIECLPPTPVAEGRVRLLFQGIFAHNRNLANLIRAMTMLRDEATLTLQGWGGVEAELRVLVEELGLQDTVEFLDRCPAEQVVQSANRFDIGVIAYKGESPNLTVAVPNKLHDYLGAGLAIAASDLPGHRSVLESTGCAVFIDPTTPETIAYGLRDLVRDRQRIAKMKQAAHELCRKLCWAQQSEHLVDIYAELVGGKAANGAD